MLEAEELMRLAIAKAKQGLAAGQMPFGCAIARQDELVAAKHNQVLAMTDSTAHAEVNAIRAACRCVGGVLLSGCAAASTCEPCPMCMAALHWSCIDTVYFGASIDDAVAAGFHQINIPAGEVVRQGGGRVRLVGGLLAEECRELFSHWRARRRARGN